MRQASEKLEPIYRAIVAETLKRNYLMMEPPPIALMTNQKESTKKACLWTYRALDGPVFFEFADGKYGSTPAKTLENYQGILQTEREQPTSAVFRRARA